MQSKAFNHRVASEIVVAKKLLEDVRNVITKRTGYKHHIITHITGFIAIAVIFTALAFAFAHDFSPTEISRNIVDVITGHKSNGAANIPSTPRHRMRQRRRSNREILLTSCSRARLLTLAFTQSIFIAAIKAACGISTLPNCRIFFLPAFCFSKSLRLRVTSPPFGNPPRS